MNSLKWKSETNWLPDSCILFQEPPQNARQKQAYDLVRSIRVQKTKDFRGWFAGAALARQELRLFDGINKTDN
jgi:hypothetical protein